MSLKLNFIADVPMPVDLMPAGNTWGTVNTTGGLIGEACFSPNQPYFFALTRYGATGFPRVLFTQLTRMNVLTNVREQVQLVPAAPDQAGTANQEQATHIIADSGGFIYVATYRGDNNNARIHKLNVSNMTEVSASAYTANLGTGGNVGVVRLATKGGIQYLAFGGNFTGLFVIRTDTMATVLDIADITGGGVGSDSIEQMITDNNGDLWVLTLGTNGNLYKVTLPGGAVTPHTNLWAACTDGNSPDFPNFMVYSPNDNSVIIGNNDRSMKKISLTTLTVTATLEATDCTLTKYNTGANNLNLNPYDSGQQGLGSLGQMLLYTGPNGLSQNFTILFDSSLHLTDLSSLFVPPFGDPASPVADDPADLIYDSSRNEVWMMQPTSDPAHNNWPTRWIHLALVPQVVLAKGGVRALVRTDAYALDHGLLDWQQNFADPTVYNDGSNLPTLTLEVAKAPNRAGVMTLLYVAQPATLDGSGVGLNVPDEVEMALMFGALADLLGADGESHDPERAQFCESMYQMIVEMTNTLLGGVPDGA
jgi:hypothetical protein